jgi:hypothetical protein
MWRCLYRIMPEAFWEAELTGIEGSMGLEAS